MPRAKRLQGGSERRLLPFGSGFCGLTPEVALGAGMTVEAGKISQEEQLSSSVLAQSGGSCA